MNKDVIKNDFGFFELAEKPSPDQLAQYYRNKYYQNEHGTYRRDYTDEEKQWMINSIKLRHHVCMNIRNKFSTSNTLTNKILDVGCGEGFTLQYFHEQGWEVCGLDYSSAGMEFHNPDMLPYLVQGDIFDCLAGVGDKGNKYDVVWLSYVLEHVLDTSKLLNLVTHVMSPNAIAVITVPNDFSALQQKLLNEKYINSPFWVSIPDHISYFNVEGLCNLAFSHRLQKEAVICDFPIDFNLFNPDTNYTVDSSKGKNVHKSRVVLENFFHEISTSKTVKLYESLAEMGLGRGITGFFTLIQK